MKSSALIYSLVCGLVAPAQADSQYQSRPDLSPPRLNITTPCPESNSSSGSCADGFLFISPFTGESSVPKNVQERPIQPGNYILTTSGDLVWSGFGYFSGWNANFQPATYRGRPVLFAFEGLHDGPHAHGIGHHTFLDDHYETIRVLRAGGHYMSDKHEFIINDDEKSALLQIWHPVPRNLSAFGGDEDHVWIVDAIFQDIDIKTGKVLFEWHSLDHISPKDAALPLLAGQAGNGLNSTVAWDYFHINSIEKGRDGHYLLSGRHMSTVYKINGTDGSIIWQLGGNKSDFALGPGVAFGYQHHARYMTGTNASVTRLSLFDNAYYAAEATAQDNFGAGAGDIHTYPYSRGKYIVIDHAAGCASLEQAFDPPGKAIVTTSQGSLQTLPGDNVLINWGSAGQVTEHAPDGSILFHAHIDSGDRATNVQSYRGFRFPWTGYSPETPALVAHARGSDGGRAQLYVSWNGDTRARHWRFEWTWGGSGGCGARQLAVVPRTGFETSLNVTWSVGMGEPVEIRATALDADGEAIGSSDCVSLIKGTTLT